MEQQEEERKCMNILHLSLRSSSVPLRVSNAFSHPVYISAVANRSKTFCNRKSFATKMSFLLVKVRSVRPVSASFLLFGV
jgi:hypothetical protein